MSMSNLFGAITGGDKKIIAVMGATGSQGGSVVAAFKHLNDDSFEIRAITRDPEADKAKALVLLVKEVVKADGDDKESMVKALEGCYGAFIMSNFWEDMDVKHEMKTLRTCKEAVKEAGVKHVVLSTLEDTRHFVNAAENKSTWKVLNEELGMYTPHFDGKGEVDAEYGELPCTKLYTSAYMENFISFGWGPTRQSDSEPYGITFPMPNDKKLALVAVEDIGKCVCAIFQDPSLIGMGIGIKSQALTGQEMAAVFEKVCGQPVKYNFVPTEVYASFGFPGADDIANMFRFYAENEELFLEARDTPKSILDKMGGTVKFEDFVIANRNIWKLEPMVVEEAESAPAPKAAATPRVEESYCCIIQ